MFQLTKSWKTPQFFKKGKKEDPGNFRPTSLTSVPGIIMEIILGGIKNHLRENVANGHSQQGGEQPESGGESPV